LYNNRQLVELFISESKMAII